MDGNPAIREEVRKFPGSPDRLRDAAKIAREGTSNDIFCALVFGRFRDMPPGSGPYRSAAPAGEHETQELLARAYAATARNELALLRGLVDGAATLGEKVSAALEEQEAWEVKANQIRILRSHGIIPHSTVEELLSG